MVTRSPAIFYAPHADDSYLSMSTDIIQHIDAGRDIIVVLATLGSSQYMQNVLNGSADTYEGHRHNPALENYEVNPLTPTDITLARESEFISEIGAYRLYANGRVNVSWGVIGFPEGISVDTSKDIIRDYERQYPAASHKVMTYLDSHSDHRNMGQAALELKQAGLISDVRYYVKYEDQNRSDVKAKNPMINRPTAAQKVVVERAGRAFRAWNPAQGSYAFGYHSVKPTFDALLADTKSVVHI